MATAGLKELGEFLSAVEMGDFKPQPYYEDRTDCLVLYLRDCPSYSKRLNKMLTLFLSNDDNSLVGVEVKGVNRLLQLNKAFGVAVIDKEVKLGVLLAFALVEDAEDKSLKEQYREPLESLRDISIPAGVFQQAA